MLRQPEIIGIYDLRIWHVITQVIPKDIKNGLQSPSPIVISQALYVFKKKSLRLVFQYDFGNLEKKSSSRVFEPATTTGYRKRLTWKPCAKNLELRRYSVLDALTCDVAKRDFAKISCVCLFRFLVPLARENAMSTEVLQCDSKTANACKQVNKLETRFPWDWKWNPRH